jgi:hypothetical protein
MAQFDEALHYMLVLIFRPLSCAMHQVSQVPFLIAGAYPPMKMEQKEFFVTSTYKIQTPDNHPEEIIQHSEQGKSLKSKNLKL